MQKKNYQIIMLAAFTTLQGQTWRSLVTESFGTSTTNGISSTPAVNISPGTTSYNPVNTANTLITDGSYAVVSNSGTPDFGSPRSYTTWIPNALDHTADAAGVFGNMLMINANPLKQGEANGSYYLYTTSVFDIPGGTYRMKFFAANLVRSGSSATLKDSHVGLTVRDQLAGGNIFSNTGSIVIPRSGNMVALSWQEINSNFQLPLNYSGSSLFFNFYNSDTDASTNGNDLVLDDLLIEMRVVNFSGKIFIDRNSDGLQQATEPDYNGSANPLYVYVVKSNNSIVLKVPVSSNGTYDFNTLDGVPYATSDIGLKVAISSDSFAVGTTFPSTFITNKINVSENVSLSNHPNYFNTGSLDGMIAITNSATDANNINFGVKPLCYKLPAITGGSVLGTKVGVTSLNRASQGEANWPEVRKGGWMVLESRSKGFVINRVTTTASLGNISPAIEGMIAYDEEADCLKIYTTKDGLNIGWYCFTDQTCPED